MRGCLIEPNPIYDARRKLLDLVVLGRHGLFNDENKLRDHFSCKEAEFQEEDSDQDDDISLP